jgi:hypothetical protein
MFDRTNRTLICSVVFLDIVEYSRQPVAEQIRLKELFNTALSEALHDIAVNDRIILDTGDGAAISFLGDPEDALFVVMTLLDHCNTASDPSKLVPIRIGINLGPVKLVKDINGRPNLIGDGINVAQRIMGFAEPGNVMVSRSYYEVVSCLSESYAQLFQYVGARTDKHVREHEVYAVGYSDQLRQSRPPKRSPLSRFGDTHTMRPMSGSRMVRYLAVGMTAVFAVAVTAWLAVGQLRTVHATPIQPVVASVAIPAPVPAPVPGPAATVKPIPAATPAPAPAVVASVTPAPTPVSPSTMSPVASPEPVASSALVAEASPVSQTTTATTVSPHTETVAKKHASHDTATSKKPATAKPAIALPSVTPATKPQEEAKPAEHKHCAPGECWANER